MSSCAQRKKKYKRKKKKRCHVKGRACFQVDTETFPSATIELVNLVYSVTPLLSDHLMQVSDWMRPLGI